MTRARRHARAAAVSRLFGWVVVVSVIGGCAAVVRSSAAAGLADVVSGVSPIGAEASGTTGNTGTPGAAAVTAAEATPPLRFGGELRVRGESFDNVMDLDDRRDDAYQFVRMRYRFWADARPREGLRLFFRLGNEYRWGVYGTAPDFNKPASIRDPESRVSLDNGWAEVAWPAASGLTWRFGRMDLAYGDGFLVFDGTPADGSSSGFFDGVRLQIKGSPIEADLFAMKLVDRGFGSAALDEDFHGLYLKRAGIDVYVLHRYQQKASIAQKGSPWQIATPRQRTVAIGNRITHLPETGWQGAAEWALEIGMYEDSTGHTAKGMPAETPPGSERFAQGMQARGGWTWAGATRLSFELGGVYLSGDNPGTKEFEGWDDFYGEWPKYSELLIYTMYDGTTRTLRVGSDGKPRSDDAGAWTNLVAGWVEVKGSPLPSLRLTARGTLLRAAQATCPGLGKNRGVLASARTDYTGISGVSLQALGEWFEPGDFYSRRADRAWYARFQVTTGF
jgi:hypothetical protein